MLIFWTWFCWCNSEGKCCLPGALHACDPSEMSRWIFFLLFKVCFSNTEMIKEQLWHYPPILDPFVIDRMRTVLSESSCLKEIGQNWPNRCSYLSNNNDALCLFGTQLNRSYWLQGPSAKSWIQILWIYHTRRSTLAFQPSEWIILFH